MISFLRGKVIDIKSTSLILDVQGVGYELHCTTTDLSRLVASQDQTISMHTHLVHREDAMLLYGFHAEKAKQAFLSLIKVSGIGAKQALNMLSHFEAEELFSHIQAENVTLLTKIPGIGAKTAKKIIFELKGVILAGGESGDHYQEDLISAFVNLGYKEADVRALIVKNQPLTQDFEADFKNLLKIQTKRN